MPPASARRRRRCRRIFRLAVPVALLVAVSACYQPLGAVDGAFEATSSPGRVRVVGWAFDPDVTTPITVHVYVSGRFAGAGVANLARPVDPAEGGARANSRYDVSVDAPVGAHDVCVYGVDGSGDDDALLACRDVRVGPAITPVDARYRASLLTAGAGRSETNSISVAGASTVLAAPAANVDGNMRFVFARAAEPVRADQTACVTWGEESVATNQPGVALRISTDGPTRAITVTKNVWGGVVDVFNVHLFDTSRPDGGLRYLDNKSLFSVLKPDGVLVPLPWRMCARAVGDALSFKVWPAAQPEPAWGDPAYGHTLQLPADAPTTGRPGWYGGHLLAGQHLTYTNLTAGPA